MSRHLSVSAAISCAPFPSDPLMEPAWAKLRLSVQIATKLNRSHIVPRRITYLLPCLGRIEDRRAGQRPASRDDGGFRPRAFTARAAQREPVGEDLLSEPKIVAELAKATLAPNPKLDWDAWVADYALVRDAIERTYPEQFKDFNRRMFEPGGFPRPLPARERKWKTPNGKANFTVPKFTVNPPSEADGVYELMTMRADGQFNTTIYNEDDRFRGIYGGRYVVLMNAEDMEEIGLEQGDLVTLSTECGDGVQRRLSDLQVVTYDIPRKTSRDTIRSAMD